MTVGELKKALEEFDDNLEVLYMDDLYGWMKPNPKLVDNDAYSDKPFVELEGVKQ